VKSTGAPERRSDAPATVGDARPARRLDRLNGPLGRRGFRTLAFGQGVSAFGDWMGTVAMMALVLDFTGSSTAVAGILVLRLLPAAIAGPLATRVTKRWNRRRVMLFSDAARAVVVALVPWVRALWWVYTWSFLLEVGSLVFLPARDSSVPFLVDDRDLESADGILLGSSYGLIPIGAGAFGLISLLVPGGRTARLPMIVVFAVDAATFIWSYVCIARIPELHEGAGAPAEPVTADEHDETGRFLDAFRIPIVRELAWSALLASLGIGCLFSLGIVFVRSVLGASDAQFAVLVALFGVGAVVGLLVLKATRSRGVGTARASLLGQGVVIAVMSLAPSIAFAFLGAVAFGAFTAATLAAAMSVLQTDVTGHDRVAAFAVFHVLIRVGLALSAVGAGIAADLVRGVDWPLFGRLEPSRLVLLLAGGLVVVSTATAHAHSHLRRPAAPAARAARRSG
jgi:predicted MFS family arabinose efflux permease